MRPASYLFLILLTVVFLVRLFVFPVVTRSLPDNRRMTLSVKLTSSPKVKGTTQTFVISPKGYENILVTSPSTPRLYYGERVKMSGTLKKKLLENKETINTIYFPTLVIQKDQDRGFAVRQKVIAVFEKYLPLDLAHLLLGIAFGIKEPLSQVFSDQIRLVGLLHVIAASGMNITLLAGGLVALLGRVLTRRMTIGITLLSIAAYAAFAGFEPSIVRAGIMGSLALLASLLGKQYFGLWALFLTGYVMLLIDPQLILDVGFQLSFLATFGIMTLKPFLAFKTPKALTAFKEDFTTSLSAQAATAPILLMTFGQVSFNSLLVNVLLLWTVPPLMVIGGAAAIAGFVFEPLAGLILYLSLPVLLLFQTVVVFFSSFPLILAMDSVPLSFLIIYYALLLFLIGLLKRKRAKRHE